MNPPPSTTSELGTSSGSGSHYQVNNTTQWGRQETVELISVRGQLERNFSTSKRNKALWETVASSLWYKGFRRTPHQCKSKWKNLVNRYKGIETSDLEHGKQFPFFAELHAVFTERTENLQQSFMDSQQAFVQPRKRMKCYSGDQLSDDFSRDEDDEGDDSNREGFIRSSSQKRKTDLNISSSSSSVQEMLRGFLQQQQMVDMQWRESMERHQRERELFEHEWRQSMEKLEKERLMMERAWMEREEQRKMREEMRAEKRDALLTSLLNKLISQDNL